jgi:sulfite oxidase
MPVTSAIVSPAPNARIEVQAGEKTEEKAGGPKAPATVDVKGFAWSGGGRGIVRVDVSADDGKTWHTATLGQGSEQPRHRAWAWTFWEAEVRKTEED